MHHVIAAVVHGNRGSIGMSSLTSPQMTYVMRNPRNMVAISEIFGQDRRDFELDKFGFPNSNVGHTWTLEMFKTWLSSNKLKERLSDFDWSRDRVDQDHIALQQKKYYQRLGVKTHACGNCLVRSPVFIEVEERNEATVIQKFHFWSKNKSKNINQVCVKNCHHCLAFTRLETRRAKHRVKNFPGYSDITEVPFVETEEVDGVPVGSSAGPRVSKRKRKPVAKAGVDKSVEKRKSNGSILPPVMFVLYNLILE